MAELKPILLVEDNPNDVELTLAALERAQLANEVVVVRDGAEALDYLFSRGEYAARRPGYPAVVLLDIKLPKRSGLEVLRWMRSIPALAQLVVVMLTSSKEHRDIEEAYAEGANSYIVKPISPTEMRDLIKSLGQYWLSHNEPPPAPGAS
jgi:CheY-like chemotaxis protein